MYRRRSADGSIDRKAAPSVGQIYLEHEGELYVALNRSAHIRRRLTRRLPLGRDRLKLRRYLRKTELGPSQLLDMAKLELRQQARERWLGEEEEVVQTDLFETIEYAC